MWSACWLSTDHTSVPFAQSVIQGVFQSDIRVCPSVGIIHIVFDSYRELIIKESEWIRWAGKQSAVDWLSLTSLCLFHAEWTSSGFQVSTSRSYSCWTGMWENRSAGRGSEWNGCQLRANIYKTAAKWITCEWFVTFQQLARRGRLSHNSSRALSSYKRLWKGDCEVQWYRYCCPSPTLQRFAQREWLAGALGPVRDRREAMYKIRLMPCTHEGEYHESDDTLCKTATSFTCWPTRFFLFFGETPVFSEADLHQAEQNFVHVEMQIHSNYGIFGQLRLEVHRHSVVGIRDRRTTTVIQGHLKRAFYVIRNALTLIADASQLDPTHCGWINQDGTILPHVSKVHRCAVSALCNCSGKCISKRCSCKTADVMCVIYCHKEFVEPICTKK